MKWANFLHIYQPVNQLDEIFEKVVNESYRPLLRALKNNPKIKISLNINGALSEQFLERGYKDLINDIILVAGRGQIEFTDSAKYHALLPFLEPDEIVRQIQLNRETNQKIFGKIYAPKGFFPPEMAYFPDLAKIIEKLGYEWMIIDEIALNGRVNQVDGKTIYKIEGTNLYVYFRERLFSNIIMSALIRRKEDFKDFLSDFSARDYMVTGMDGETFGHHRPGLQELLTGLLTSDDFEHVFFSDLPKLISHCQTIGPIASNWASTEKDIEQGETFLTWKDDQNKIHELQWGLQRLALDSIKKYYKKSKDSSVARHKLDQALASDQFFWASARPWWSLEVIEAGAWALLDAIRSIPKREPKIFKQAEKLYHTIIALSFEWQRTGYIRKIYKEYKQAPRIPFKERTVEKGEPWVFDAFLELMSNAMREAAKKENFEEATLWRDAIWKLKTKNDIYDAIHAVDLLRKQVTNKQVLDTIGKYRREHERLSSGQPEQRGV